MSHKGRYDNLAILTKGALNFISSMESVGTIRGKAAKELELVRAEQSKLPTGSGPAL